MFEDLFVVDPIADESALIARIEALERLKSAAAAAQAHAAAAFAAARAAAEAADGTPARRRGRGVGAEIALARHDSPARGDRHLGFAKALVHEMPHTLAALECGALSEWRATLIVRESACLDVEDRRALDAELCADRSRLEGLGDRRIAADAKAIAYRLDPHAVVERAARAERERTVTIRPAPDCMTYLTALLPLAQGVSVYAALKRSADTCGDGRGRGQVMADTLVERVTGRPATVAEPDRGEPGALRRDAAGRRDSAGDRDRLRPDTGPGGQTTDQRRRRRPAIPRHPAPAVPPSAVRGAGGDGVTVAAVSERAGAVHRAARRNLPDSVLRCPDPAHRSRHSGCPGRADHRRQRDRPMRGVQLHQGSSRVDSDDAYRRKRLAHCRSHHPDRNNASLDRSAGRGMGPP